MDFVDPILSLCLGIHQMAENMKANKERCQRVANRVRALEELVLTIKQRGRCQISAVVENALRELCSTLAFAKGVLIKYSQTKKVENFLKSRSHKDKFRELNERLSENFQVLSGALQIEQLYMVHTVYEASSGRSPTGVDFNGQTLTGTMPPMSCPTTPMPLSSTRSMSSHRPSMPLSSSMPPTALMPLPGTMAPRPFFSTMAPRPFFSTMASMPFFSTMASMPFFSTMASMPFSSTMAPGLSYTSWPPGLSYTSWPQGPQLTFPPQNNSVVGHYVVNNSFNT